MSCFGISLEFIAHEQTTKMPGNTKRLRKISFCVSRHFRMAVCQNRRMFSYVPNGQSLCHSEERFALLDRGTVFFRFLHLGDRAGHILNGLIVGQRPV